MSGRDGGVGAWIDIFRVREYFDIAGQLRDLARRTQDDRRFIGALRRSLLRVPGEVAPHVDVAHLWTGRVKRVPLKTARLGIVASGGSGALASLVGVLKACQELDVEPTVMSFASGAALFGFPLAAGKSPDEVADFVLNMEPGGWLDPDWLGVVSIVPRLGRGFAGIMRGKALESAYRELLGPITLGDLRIPSYVPVWNVEHNRLEYIGPRTHANLPVAKAVRMAVSLPLFFDPVKWNGGSWCDGAIVDIFPVHPLLEIEPGCDAVLALNCFYPPGFAGEDARGWRTRRWSVLDLADQAVTAQHVQLARENLKRLRSEVPTVMLMEPVPYRLVRRTGLYTQFLDSSAWPAFMRAGRKAAAALLVEHLGRPRVKRSA